MAKLTVSLANCLISGADITHGESRSWTRDRIDLLLEGTPVVLRQTDAGRARSRIPEHQTVHTSDLEFGDVPPSRVRRLENLANDIAWLLCLSTASPVRPLWYEYGSAGHGSLVTQHMTHFRPLLETADGEATRRFLQNGITPYRTLRRKRRLARVIDYLVIAEHPHQALEVRFLLALTALETLKTTHTPGVRGHFRQRVETMLKAVGMRRKIGRLIKVRDRLVHEGLAGVPYVSLRGHYDRLQDILREYLMRLLRYRGQILLYSKAARQVKVI